MTGDDIHDNSNNTPTLPWTPQCPNLPTFQYQQPSLSSPLPPTTFDPILSYPSPIFTTQQTFHQQQMHYPVSPYGPSAAQYEEGMGLTGDEGRFIGNSWMNEITIAEAGYACPGLTNLRDIRTSSRTLGIGGG
ncbi:hypothetical protein HK097_004246, partial [Rhizophlyctis rosea]